MIIRLFVRDFLSFNDEIEFSLYPGQGSYLSNHIVRNEKRDDIPALKTGILYGANASGKSNLVKAIGFMEFMVTKGFPLDGGIVYNPFKLKKPEKQTRSKLELELKISDKCYSYGFEFNNEMILEEWLFEINKRTEKEIFSRNFVTDHYETSFDGVTFTSKENEEFARFTARGTPKNRLFLRECRERNLDFIEEIDKVYVWFDSNLKIIFPKTRYEDLEFKIDENQDFANLFSEFLKYFKTGVHKLVKQSVDPEKDIKDIPIDLIRDIISDLKPKRNGLLSLPDMNKNYALQKSEDGEVHAYVLGTEHLAIDGSKKTFDLDEESDGTRRLLDIIPSLIDLTKNDSVYVIDEIDRSMHPILTKGILEYFFSNAMDAQGQLILTTHESCLLDLNLLRKDEIWFVEKDKTGSTKLYSLLEFKPRKDKDIRKGYLNGRYGAIPFLANPKDLNW
ncbi:MAG: AAA family ATPase [Bacteroidota bacterium]